MELQNNPEETALSASTMPSEATITSRSLVDLIWQLRWQSDTLLHTEEFFTPLNVWRDVDLCPTPLARELFQLYG